MVYTNFREKELLNYRIIIEKERYEAWIVGDIVQPLYFSTRPDC